MSSQYKTHGILWAFAYFIAGEIEITGDNEIDKTKGFVIKTDENDLIDIGWENYVNSIKRRLLKRLRNVSRQGRLTVFQTCETSPTAKVCVSL